MSERGHAVVASGRGRTSRRYRALVKWLRAQRYACWLCGQPIDYSAKPQTPDAFEPDHVYPLSTHPELAEDPGNLRASHCRCNRARGNRQPKPGLGDRSRNW